MKFSDSDDALEASGVYSTPKIIHPNTHYTVTLDFFYDHRNFLYRGFLFRLSDKNDFGVDESTLYIGNTTSAGVQNRACGAGVSGLTHTNNLPKTSTSFDFMYKDMLSADLSLEVTVVRERTANYWLYSKFDLEVQPQPITPAPVKVTPAPVKDTPAPAATLCVDRTGKWSIGDRTINWCNWAANGSDPPTRCRKKDLYMDCPVTCNSCSSPTPAPVSTSCTDRTGKWTIGSKTRKWCYWAANGDIDVRCSRKDLYTDCPVTCQSCPSTCSPDPLDFHPTIGMQVDYVGSVPTNNTQAWSYNMNVEDNFDNGALYFLDQLNGIIYAYDSSDSSISKIYDIATDYIPAGLTLDYPVGAVAGPGQTSRIHSITKGSSSSEIIVVFSSTTLPEGYTEAQAQLPLEGMFPGYACVDPQPIRDLYRLGNDVDCLSSQTIYNVFYKYIVAGDGSLTNPDVFFALENQFTPGHLGGAIVTLDNGNVLWGTGDCLPVSFCI